MGDGNSSHGDFEIYVISILGFVILTLFYGRILWSVPWKKDLGFIERLQMHLANSAIGQLCEVIVAVASFGSCVLFIWDTYLADAELWMFSSELAFSWLFMYQFFMEYYVAKNKYKYLTSLQAVVDLLTVTPVMFLAVSGFDGASSNTGFLRSTRVMKITRVFNLIRVVRSMQVLSNPVEDAINAQVIDLTSTLLSMIVIAAGFVQFLDSVGHCFSGDVLPDGKCETPIFFHDAFYYTIVTFTSVGYGDMMPVSTTGRMVTLVLIIAFFYILPAETGKLGALLAMRSRYDGKAKLAKNSIHVVLCCDEGCTGVDSFLQQFFHEDHGLLHSQMVVLCPGEPDQTWRSLILKYKKRISYVKGDFIKRIDLLRAEVGTSVCCFIMADRLTSNTNAQDAKNILRAETLMAFNTRINCFVQLIEPENRKHLLQLGIHASRIICHNEFKMGLMAQGCLWRGFATLVANLLCVATSDEFKAESAWEEEYVKGAQQEVYRGPVGLRYAGKTFNEAVVDIYKQSGVLLIAIANVELGSVLNPGKAYRVKPHDFGFLIGDNHESITNLLEPEEPVNWLHGVFGVHSPNKRPSFLVHPIGSEVSDADMSPAKALSEDHNSMGEGLTKAMNDMLHKKFGDKKPAPKNISKKGRRGSLNVASLLEDDVYADEHGSEPLTERTLQPWYRPLDEAMHEYAKTAVEVSGHIVALCPSLDDIGALLEMVRLPHLAQRAVVILAPVHILEGARERGEMEIDWLEIMAFPDIHLVCGSHDDTYALWRAGVSRAHVVMIFSEGQCKNVDSALILKSLSVSAELRYDKRVLVELNDTTVIQHFGFVTEVAIAAGRVNGIESHRPASADIAQRGQRTSIGLLSGPASPTSPTSPTSAMTTGAASPPRQSTPSAGQRGDKHTGGKDRDAPAAANDDKLYTGRVEGVVDRVVVNRHYQLDPAYLSGDVVMSNVSSLLLCQAFFNPHIIGIISVLIGATMEEPDESGVAKSSLVQIQLPAEFKHMSGAKQYEEEGVVQWKYADVFDYLMGEDILPIALYRLGSTSRGSLHLDIGEGETKVMPEHSFLVTNPAPEQLVGEHDLICCCIYSSSTYDNLKTEEPPHQNMPPPLSHEGRRLSHLELATEMGAGAAAGAGVNKSVRQLHQSVDMLLGNAAGEKSSMGSAVSSGFSRLQKSLDTMVGAVVEKDRELFELRGKIERCEQVMQNDEAASQLVSIGGRRQAPSPTHPHHHPLTPNEDP